MLGSTDFTDLTAPAAAMERPEGVPVIEIDPASIVCETIDYARTEEILPEVDALTKEDAALLLIGNFDPNAKGFASMIGTAGRHVCGAAGESCSTVKGIPWLIMADGPAGLRLAKEYYEDGKGKHAVGNASMPDSIMEMLSGPMKLVMSLMGGSGKPKAGCEIWAFLHRVPPWDCRGGGERCAGHCAYYRGKHRHYGGTAGRAGLPEQACR